MKLAYKAYDGVGKAVTGIVDAGDVAGAADLLRRKGLFVAEVKPSIPTEGKRVRLGRRHSSRSQRLKDVAWFSRQIYVLVSSGRNFRTVCTLSSARPSRAPGAR